MQLVPVAAVEPNQSPNPALETKISTSRRRVWVLSVLSLTASIAATLWYEQVRYERFPGFLQARLRTVAAAREAQVAEILVSPGTVVMAGQPLVRLKDTAFEQRLEAKQRDVESLEIEMSRSQASLEVELELRRKDILASILDAKLKSAQASRKGLVPTGIAAHRKSGWGSADSSDERPAIQQTGGDQPAAKPAAEPSKLALTDVELLAQHIDELERINRELPDKISRSMGVDLAKARLAHARAELTRLESQQRELTLVAESSGLVGVFNKEVGDHISARNQPIVQLLDEEQPYLLLQIPSSRISDFAPGTLVDLHFPGGKTGQGRVEEIPPQTSPIPAPGANSADTVITAHIEPVGPLWPILPFGSEVEVRRQR